MKFIIFHYLYRISKMNIYLIIFTTAASSIICTFTPLSSIGNAVNNILNFSVSDGQLTILYGDNTGGIYVSSIYSYDVASNQSTLITNIVSISSLRFFGQKGKPSGVQYWYIFQNSQWLAIYTNDFSNFYTGFYGSGVISVFGANQATVYMAVNKPSPACEYQVMSLMPPTTTTTFYTITDYLCGDVVYNDNRIYYIASSTINTTIKVDIIDTSSLSLITSLSYQNQTGKFQIDVFPPYFVIAIDTKFTVYFVSNFAKVCQSTVSSQIADIKLNSKWIFVSDLYNIYQFMNSNCMMFGTSPPTQLSMGSQIRIDESNINRCFYLQKSLSSTSIGYLEAQDKYFCLGGCSSCISNYSLDTNLDCYFVDEFAEPSYCFQQQNEVCQIFCDHKCQNCIDFYDKCVLCNFFRQMNQQQICQIPALRKLLIIAVNLVKAFRVKKNQNMFFLIDNFELYNYHKSPYDEMFRGILDMMGELDSFKWSFFPFDFILDWTKKPYKTERYNHFTNERFLQVEQMNSLLLETLKSLYLISFSLILIVFITLNRLFHCLKDYRVSFLIRTYSFFFQFILILFISNSTKICFLSFHYFGLLFSSSYVLKILHSLSILFCGVFLMLLLTFFFLSEFLYGKLSKYFLFNCYRVQHALPYNFILFSLRPLIQSSLHVFLYNDNANQIMILGSFQLVLLVYTVFLQLSKTIFKSKFTFMIEFCIAFCMLLINLLLYFKNYIYTSESQSEKAILSVLQSGIQNICYMIAGFVAIQILQSYSSFLNFFGQKESIDIYAQKTPKKEESQKNNHNKKMAVNPIQNNKQATQNKSCEIVVEQYVAKVEKRKSREQNVREKEEQRNRCRQSSQKIKNKAIRLFLTSHTIEQRKDGKATRLHHLKFIGRYQ